VGTLASSDGTERRCASDSRPLESAIMSQGCGGSFEDIPGFRLTGAMGE